MTTTSQRPCSVCKQSGIVAGPNEYEIVNCGTCKGDGFITPKPELPKAYGGRPFRAQVVGHNWRGSTCLMIGAEGYNKEAFVCLTCTDEERRQFPIGTMFDLVVVEESRGEICEACDGTGYGKLEPPEYWRHICQTCYGSGRKK